jgi:predicted dehydrogenase
MMFNVLIIGCGRQGALSDIPGSENSEKIISFAHAFKEHPGFKLLGFCDIDKEKAVEAAITWKTDYWSGYPIDADVIVIATSDESHYEPLLKALDRKPQLVICEKPLTTDLQQAREIVALYEAKGIPLMCNYTRRFIPELQELKRRYDAGEFGKIVSANIVFNRGWEHTATHAIDLCEWLFNGQYNGKIMECETDYRIWQIDLFFEKHHWREERIGDMPVPAYFDKHMAYVAENAFGFLEGREPLRCTGEDALKSLEICYELIGGAK